jgi:microcin C transport system substrate-binding protein
MVHYARALDRVLQWGYYMIPNYYSKGTPTVYQNRFGMPRGAAGCTTKGWNTWWEVSAKALTTPADARPARGGPVTCCVI